MSGSFPKRIEPQVVEEETGELGIWGLKKGLRLVIRTLETQRRPGPSRAMGHVSRKVGKWQYFRAPERGKD